MRAINPYITELTWKEMAKTVATLNPELAALINNISPDDHYKLYRVRYRYGSEPLYQGLFHLPNEAGDMQSIHEIALEPRVKDNLMYNLGSNPVSLILKNTFELYLPLVDRIVPLYGLMYPGKLFGTWWVLSKSGSYQPTFSWHMSAGARSIIMLPKITNKTSHFKLQKAFEFRIEPPLNLIDQWNVFRKIANHSRVDEPWEAEILYFSGQWFQSLEDERWLKLKDYLFQQAWATSDYWRNQFTNDLLYSFVQSQRGIRFSPYVLDTLKHILAIAMGVYQGAFPVQDSATAPYEQLQDAYIDVYQLKDYHPTILVPRQFQLDDPSGHSVVYYSLNNPTAAAFSPKDQLNSSMISDLQDIKATYDRYLRGLDYCHVQLEPSRFAEVVKRVKFDYIHADANHQYADVQPSEVVPSLDAAFIDPQRFLHNQEFAKNSPFFKGCVRLSLQHK